MALKGEYRMVLEEVRYICEDVTERGVILVFDTGVEASGNIVEQGGSVVLPGTGSVSGLKPAGLLMNDFVDIDESRYHVNYHKREQQVGTPAWLMRKGWAITDMTAGSPAAGAPAYLAASGLISTTQASGAPQVGVFLGSDDQDGFACVEIDL